MRYKIAGFIQSCKLSCDQFFEPNTRIETCIKSSVTILLLFLGIGIFLRNMHNYAAYEYACEHPVWVDATVTIMPKQGYYDWYLSYDHDGLLYENIFYRSNQNYNAIQYDGDTISIAVDPQNPSVPVETMVKDLSLGCSIALFSLGLSVVVYSIALSFESFRSWRCRKHIMKYSCPDAPDYIKDFCIIFAVTFALIFLIILQIYPNSLLYF